jgi:RNase H-fold protein (predicted Holliday junction resolvase)
MENNTLPETEKIIDFKTYKWLVSSCLQKSIRRGRYDLAKPYVEFLWEHDRNYITYRFGTMLTEDVGIANVELLDKYLSTKLAKRTIDDKGGLEFILKLTEEACNSPKDRSSCDAGYVAGFYGLSQYNGSVEEVFLNPQNHYIERINASWSVLGSKKFQNPQLSYLAEDNLPGYLELVKKSTSEEFAKTVELAYNSQIENICLGMPVVMSAYEYEKANVNHNSKLTVGKVIENMYVKETSFLHEPTGLEIISCGVDGHTREGKTVYFQYLKNRSEFTRYLNAHKVDYEKHIDILKHCLFRTEGHEVNKRIYFPSAVQIMRECESNILNIKAGFNDNRLNFNEINDILLKDIPLLNQMRESTLKNAQVPMIDKPEPKKPRKSKNSV